MKRLRGRCRLAVLAGNNILDDSVTNVIYISIVCVQIIWHAVLHVHIYIFMNTESRFTYFVPKNKAPEVSKLLVQNKTIF
jgi:hypothetical protein